MATLNLEQVQGRLQPLLRDGETLQHWAFGQTKPKPKLWVLLLFPVALLLAIVVAVFGAQLAIGIGLIEPGPMMPLVGVPLAVLVLGPYLYLVLNGISQCGVGLTNRRLLIVDLREGDNRMPTKEFSAADGAPFKFSVGLVPQLTVRSQEGVLKLAFPLNIRGNKEQATAMAERFAGR